MNPVPVIRGNKIAMLVICYVCLNTSFLQAQCIDTTANATVSASKPANGSIYSFTTPLSALNNDGNWASAASLIQLFGDKLTDQLQVKGFGFNIPTAASICGIQVRVVRSAGSLDLLHLANIKDNEAQLMKGGVPVGSDNVKTSIEWPDSDGDAIYGNSTDLWSTAWTPADINSPNFGFSIAAKIHGLVALFPVAKINFVSITVSYLPPTLLTVPSPAVRNSKGQSSEPADNLVLKCYPNPATTTIQVVGVLPGERVVLSDLFGKSLFRSAPAINNFIQLDVAHLQSGMYVISTGNRKIKMQKK